MSKRSNFERIEKDFYPTIDERAVIALISHIELFESFYEPCCGDGILINQLDSYSLECLGSSDLPTDATHTKYESDATYFITNPPWSRHILHPLIVNLSDQKPTWLLFDADWIHTKQSMPYLDRLKKIVSVGRLIWIPGTRMQSKDNCCWYLFDKPSKELPQFYGRKNYYEQ